MREMISPLGESARAGDGREPHRGRGAGILPPSPASGIARAVQAFAGRTAVALGDTRTELEAV